MITDAPIAPTGVAGLDPQCLTTNLGWLLSQASFAYGCEQAKALEPLGLGARGCCVLTTAMTGEYTQTQLAHAVGIDKTMMMVTLDELEQNGLAERRRSPTDRRAHVIEVTAAGRAKVAQAQAIIDEVQEAVLSSLPARQREAFWAGLRHLVTERLAEPPECTPAVRRREPRA
ncbi:MAG TPA: MarR family winged helix-turn-helix transcriptional regulator [Solirubrobacteraceae bacterium]|jgi:DNA-binding MarR family transcriptional regulator|nr:MarR family winged helix-turn-helix transcriptional regulator [Solirubrobacteraceae bacterium]